MIDKLKRLVKSAVIALGITMGLVVIIASDTVPILFMLYVYITLEVYWYLEQRDRGVKHE